MAAGIAEGAEIRLEQFANALANVFATVEKLVGHFEKHGPEFGHADAKQYNNAARDFMRGPLRPGEMQKTRANGDVLRYDPKTNTFGAMDKNGTVRTMFKPTNGASYFQGQ